MEGPLSMHVTQDARESLDWYDGDTICVTFSLARILNTGKAGGLFAGGLTRHGGSGLIGQCPNKV